MGVMRETLTVDIVTRAADAETLRTQRVAQLFEDHQGRLFRLARRLSPDAEEARDLLQETFLRVARRPRSVPHGRVSEEAWLVRILINLSRDLQRRRVVRERGRGRLEERALSPTHPEPAVLVRLAVERALGRLSPRRRAVVVLHELEGMPVARIAETLHTARVTIRWHLSQARKQLAVLLAPEYRRSQDRGNES